MRLACAGASAVALLASLSSVEGQVRPCPATGIRCEKTTGADPGAWLPLCVGTRWQYRKAYGSVTDDPGLIARVRWTSTEEVVSRTPCRGGVVVRIDAAPRNVQRDYPAGISADYREWFDTNVGTAVTHGYFVRGSAVYNFAPGSWDDPCAELTEARLAELDEREPAFFFPLEDGSKWSDRRREEADVAAICAASRGEAEHRSPRFHYWEVDGRDSLELPWRRVRGAWHLRFFSVGGAPHRWFVRNVGVVKESFSRRGSYLEHSSELLSFKAGQGCR